ncbi:MAG TPA: MerR family transcriptional regulator [Chthonomonadaceae bacterium]|nr:MerR family transcriptional regulator [Chthonomonadaceae bacterium]
MDKTYTLEELAAEAGVSISAVRYYIREGLLEGPETRGRYARYTDRHLAALRRIQELAGRGLKVAGIKQQLRQEDAGAYVQRALAALLREKPIPEPVSHVGIASTQETEHADTWKRIRLAGEVEILFRYPASPEMQARIDRMIACFHSNGNQEK